MNTICDCCAIVNWTTKLSIIYYIMRTGTVVIFDFKNHRLYLQRWKLKYNCRIPGRKYPIKLAHRWMQRWQQKMTDHLFQIDTWNRACDSCPIPNRKKRMSDWDKQKASDTHHHQLYLLDNFESDVLVRRPGREANDAEVVAVCRFQEVSGSLICRRNIYKRGARMRKDTEYAAWILFGNFECNWLRSHSKAEQTSRAMNLNAGQDVCISSALVASCKRLHTKDLSIRSG